MHLKVSTRRRVRFIHFHPDLPRSIGRRVSPWNGYLNRLRRSISPEPVRPRRDPDPVKRSNHLDTRQPQPPPCCYIDDSLDMLKLNSPQIPLHPLNRPPHQPPSLRPLPPVDICRPKLDAPAPLRQ